jgi:hypothetical protein
MSLENGIWIFRDDITTAADAKTLQNFEYYELQQINERFSKEAGMQEAVRIYIVPFEDRKAFIEDCLGYSEWQDQTLHREPPDRHEYFTHLYACDCAVEGFGMSEAGYDTAKVTVMYRPQLYVIKPDNERTTELERYIIREEHPENEWVEYPTSKPFQFVSGSKDVLAKQPAIPTSSTKRTYIWKEVPEIDEGVMPLSSVISRYSCSLNSLVFDGIYPAGTIYFAGYDPVRTFPTVREGVVTWDIALEFIYRNNGVGVNVSDGTTVGDPQLDQENDWAGHNHVWNNLISPPRFDLVTDNGEKTGNTLYNKVSDLNAIFSYPI